MTQTKQKKEASEIYALVEFNVGIDTSVPSLLEDLLESVDWFEIEEVKLMPDHLDGEKVFHMWATVVVTKSGYHDIDFDYSCVKLKDFGTMDQIKAKHYGG